MKNQWLHDRLEKIAFADQAGRVMAKKAFDKEAISKNVIEGLRRANKTKGGVYTDRANYAAARLLAWASSRGVRKGITESGQALKKEHQLARRYTWRPPRFSTTSPPRAAGGAYEYAQQGFLAKNEAALILEEAERLKLPTKK